MSKSTMLRNVTSLILAALPGLLAVLGAGSAAAQPTPPALVELALPALGGASVKVPETWKEIKKEPGLVVREQAPDPAAQVPFLVLVCSIEEGPPIAQPGGQPGDGAAPSIPWLKVRDNIEEAAEKGGRKVTLTVGDAFKDAPGFEGRRLQGELESPGAPGAPAKKVAIELVALVKNERLLTIGLLADPGTAGAARDMVATIAKTARLGP